ncbi:hypothetical protein SAMD00019534_035120 [Acytostelium subglobosum LB1]|uniref:hypothetical protein n=1 Tax=Acytostelium subglobosum LB1 TaxID=1410327 RepID=UPI0006451739|nr:hypothetical protein SAMD00019534_035120 [Acytostelium subglobosum LB1]GAM20337.1 hypothetical protein SAMD00019534_035120 [Acytostelium subglobosum LB1]|eukprot:XP_012759858.1 hypothetical protein SAMD00019534_035120 [Acytostelium subglobosum LB1]
MVQKMLTEKRPKELGPLPEIPIFAFIYSGKYFSEDMFVHELESTQTRRPLNLQLIIKDASKNRMFFPKGFSLARRNSAPIVSAIQQERDQIRALSPDISSLTRHQQHPIEPISPIMQAQEVPTSAQQSIPEENENEELPTFITTFEEVTTFDADIQHYHGVSFSNSTMSLLDHLFNNNQQDGTVSTQFAREYLEEYWEQMAQRTPQLHSITYNVDPMTNTTTTSINSHPFPNDKYDGILQLILKVDHEQDGGEGRLSKELFRTLFFLFNYDSNALQEDACPNGSYNDVERVVEQYHSTISNQPF